MNMIPSRPKLRQISAFLTKPIILRCSSKTLADQPKNATIPPILGNIPSTSTRNNDDDDVLLFRQLPLPRCCWWGCSQWSSSHQEEKRIGNNLRFLSTTTASTATAFTTTTTTTSDNDDDITPNDTINNNTSSNNNNEQQQQLATNEYEHGGENSNSNNNNPIDRQARWDRMFEALVQYKSIHGDTLVPATYPDNPQLGNWVDNKRQLYRLRLGAEEEEDNNNNNNNKQSPYHRLLTDEKIAQLNSIDFVWSIYEYSWNVRYHELKAYVSQHGNALVPSDYPANESLGQWVLSQRRNYKRSASGGYKQYKYKENTTTLSKERIAKLNDIGFVWDVHEAQWFERLEELKIYIGDHGDTLVPKVYSELPYLGRWVDKQRLDYKRYMAKKKLEAEFGGGDGDGDEGNDDDDGKKSRSMSEERKKEMERVNRLSTGMTEERIRLLEAEGFIWDAIEYLWDSKFRELCNFVAVNGHAAIFRRSNRPYDPLARWAEVQRENYKKFQRGERTKLTEERIERLNAINFVWGSYLGWKKERRRKNGCLGSGRERVFDTVEEGSAK